jgi:hypothetical protein
MPPEYALAAWRRQLALKVIGFAQQEYRAHALA